MKTSDRTNRWDEHALKGNLTGELKFGGIDLTAKFNNYRKNAIEQFSSHDESAKAHDLCNDLNKLLELYCLIRPTTSLKEALGQQFKEFVQKARLEQYGAPSRIPAALKQEIEDAFKDCRFDNDYDVLEDKLHCFKKSFSSKKDKAGAQSYEKLNAHDTSYDCKKEGKHRDANSVRQSSLLFVIYSNQVQAMMLMAKLYEKYCVVDNSSAIEEWRLLDCAVLKELYDLGRSSVKTSTNAKASSLEDCL
ncbi:hypothetical protein BD560DRAFT_422481 [Blakeslea trispora]|nr:hypothetical protein BD560DRAFT_422481 [Blakeslea trispora]